MNAPLEEYRVNVDGPRTLEECAKLVVLCPQCDAPVRRGELPRTCPECGAALSWRCPWVNCEFHLFTDISRSGDVLFPRGGGDPLAFKESCLLDVISGGEATLLETGKLFGLTRERVRQIEAKALEKMALRFKARGLGFDDLSGELGGVGRHDWAIFCGERESKGFSKNSERSKAMEMKKDEGGERSVEGIKRLDNGARISRVKELDDKEAILRRIIAEQEGALKALGAERDKLLDELASDPVISRIIARLAPKAADTASAYAAPPPREGFKVESKFRESRVFEDDDRLPLTNRIEALLRRSGPTPLKAIDAAFPMVEKSAISSAIQSLRRNYPPVVGLDGLGNWEILSKSARVRIVEVLEAVGPMTRAEIAEKAKVDSEAINAILTKMSGVDVQIDGDVVKMKGV